RNYAAERIQAWTALGRLTQEALKEGGKISYEDYADALCRLQEIRVQWAEQLAAYDAILTHSAPSVAPRGLASTGDSSCYRVWSFLGWAAIHLPTRFDVSGMPMGVQLTARPGRDLELLQLAQLLHPLVDQRE